MNLLGHCWGVWTAKKWLPAALPLFVLGCGFLSDYESHIDKQKTYLEQFDLENKLIGEPLEQPLRMMPDKTEQPLPAMFFLRPPRDLALLAEQPPTVYPEKKGDNQVVLFRYPIKKEKPEPGKPERTEFLFHGVFVTTATLADDKLKEGREEFRSNVVKALNAYPSVKGIYVPKDAKFKPYTVQGSPLKFQTLELPGTALKDKAGKDAAGKDGYQWYFFLYFTESAEGEGRKALAAVIYQVPFEKREDATARKTRELSLRWLGIGDEMNNKIRQYTRYKR